MFQQVESVGGWSFDQVLVLIGIVTTIDYVVEVWLYPSLSKITTYVQRGEFDVLLVKPVRLAVPGDVPLSAGARHLRAGGRPRHHRHRHASDSVRSSR